MYLTKLLHFIFGRPTADEEKLVKRLTARSMKTTQTGLGGYRVDAVIDDWKKVNEELDMAKKIVENDNKGLSKDEIFRQALLVLLKSLEVKTVKIDKLIEELEKMG